MNLKFNLCIALLAFTIFSSGQTSPVIVPASVNLPKDTLIARQLIRSLNGFLDLKEKPNRENTFVLKEDLLETSVLLDEIKGIEKNAKYKDDRFCKCYLGNVVELDKSNFLIQFFYMGMDTTAPVLTASFELLAKKIGEQFYFCSPLKRNTSSWKTLKTDKNVFRYKNNIHENKIKEYEAYVRVFDKKLNATTEKIEWYGCNDMPEILQSIGVLYKLDYNGKSSSTFSARENNTLLLVSGSGTSDFNAFDPHDLWHDRLRNVLSPEVINRPVDEGCAYLYGGSWGISWEQILQTFKEKIASDAGADWLKLYEDFYNFSDDKNKSLIVGYVINALLVEKIEKEKGFPAVMELLSCGNYEKTNEKYFAVLEKLTGINKSNFNTNVRKLIAGKGK